MTCSITTQCRQCIGYFKVIRSYERSKDASYLRSQLFDLISELLALARVLPFGRLLTFNDLQQVQVLLFQLFLLGEQLVETANEAKVTKVYGATMVVNRCCLRKETSTLKVS